MHFGEYWTSQVAQMVFIISVNKESKTHDRLKFKDCMINFWRYLKGG